MKIEISRSERNTLLDWADESKSKAGHYGDGDAAFPDEERLVDTLKSHPGGPLDLGLNKIMIILSWAESVVDRHFGRGRIVNPIEEAIVAKAKKAYNVLTNGKEEPDEPKGADGESAKKAEKPLIPKAVAKAIRWFVLASALAVLVVLVVGVLQYKSSMGTKAIARGGEYQVKFVTGDVFWKRARSWKRLGPSERLMPGDSIKTGDESTVTVSNNLGARQIRDNALAVLK